MFSLQGLWYVLTAKNSHRNDLRAQVYTLQLHGLLEPEEAVKTNKKVYTLQLHGLLEPEEAVKTKKRIRTKLAQS